MAGNHDGAEVREAVFLGQQPQNLIDEIERGQLGMTGRVAAGSPAVARAAPAHLVFRKLVVTVARGRGDARRDHNGVVERVRQERRGDGGREIVIRVPIGAVDHDHRSADVVVARLERTAAIDQRTRRSAAERHPLGALHRRVRARRRRR